MQNTFFAIISVSSKRTYDLLPIHERNVVSVVHSWELKNHTWEVTEALRPAIITLDWQQKNKTVFKSVNYAGYIGILTAIKPVRFTVKVEFVTLHLQSQHHILGSDSNKEQGLVSPLGRNCSVGP